jgi:hypothetical protein
MTKETLVRVIREILQGRTVFQSDYDVQIVAAISEPGGRIEQRTQKLRALLRLMDEAQGALRRAIDTLDQLNQMDAETETPPPPPVLESDIIRQVKAERDEALRQLSLAMSTKEG